MLTKLKRLVRIYDLFDGKNNIDRAISLFKPPIFWKDKPLVTQQMRAWKKNELNNLIYQSSQVECLIKKNLSMSKSLLFDFIISSSK